MDATTAGRAARALELLHAMSYFVPEAQRHLTEAGLTHPRMCYFAGRSAPLGRPVESVVTATFYNFAPATVARFIPQAWSLAEPSAIVDARYAAVSEAYVRVLGANIVGSAAMAEAAMLARRAAEAIPDSVGRPLSAAYCEIAWPTEPHMVFWHALTLLREYRGDGHIAALVCAGLSGLEALITHTATGRGFEAEFARTLRGWSSEEWADASMGLVDRGVLDSEGALTDAGVALRRTIEHTTDRLGEAPWRALGFDDAAHLVTIATPWRETMLAAGVFPDELFGPRAR